MILFLVPLKCVAFNSFDLWKRKREQQQQQKNAMIDNYWLLFNYTCWQLVFRLSVLCTFNAFIWKVSFELSKLLSNDSCRLNAFVNPFYPVSDGRRHIWCCVCMYLDVNVLHKMTLFNWRVVWKKECFIVNSKQQIAT